MFRTAPVALFGLMLACGSNGDTGNPEQQDIGFAQSLTAGDGLATWPEPVNAPVVLYVDRSGSMRGFLDPEYPSRTDYRRIIDRLIVALAPREAFGFGSDVTPIPTSLGTLGNRDFYDDNNTEMEDALALIALDSTASATHLVIGDGRRSDPNLANEQYVRLRDLAYDWIERGGTFLIAASRAPFAPVPGDPAGCRPASDAESATCPLYAFAFIADGDETRIVGTFAAANTFEHVFVWPIPATDRTVIQPVQENRELTFEGRWAVSGEGLPIARVRGGAYTNTPMRARLELDASSDPAAAAARTALAGQSLLSSVSVRPLDDPTGASDWQPVSGSGSTVTPVEGDPRAIDIRSLGDPTRFLYRIDLYPTAETPWLQEFDAERAGDEVRTFGLGLLFELFGSLAQGGDPAPVQRAYVVVN